MKEIKLVLVGFGNVGKAFVRLLDAKRGNLNNQFGFDPKVVGIATGRHGMAIDPGGLDTEKAIRLCEAGETLETLSSLPAPRSVLEFIAACQGEVLFEISPVKHHSGQPAIDHIKAALNAHMHAITANKGPVAHAYTELTALAKSKNKRFLFESSVMDGAPIFSLFREPLPAVEVLGFHGILNSCTNLLLEMMEQGKTFEEAVKYGQSIGITETNPAADIDGWDAAIKTAILCTTIMGRQVSLDQVERQGIREISPLMIRDALQSGERWKLVCDAHREKDGIKATVAPQRIKPGDPLYSINGTSSFVQFQLDTLPGLGILESDPGPITTAYGLLADLINAVRGVDS